MRDGLLTNGRPRTSCAIYLLLNEIHWYIIAKGAVFDELTSMETEVPTGDLIVGDTVTTCVAWTVAKIPKRRAQSRHCQVRYSMFGHALVSERG